MSINLRTLRQGISDTVQAAITPAVMDPYASLTCTPRLTGTPTPPHFFVAETTIDYTASTHGYDTARIDTLDVTARILCPHGEEGQDLLDELLSGSGPRAVKKAIDGVLGVAQTFNGSCQDATLTRVDGYRLYEHGSGQYVGADLTIKVVG